MSITERMRSIGVAAILIFSATANGAPSLTVGDPAPKLAVIKWVKGEPVPEFKKGQVYIVEFWATWCAPCVAGAVHLSELARQYRGRVTFIGLHSEAAMSTKPATEDYLRYVEKFVEKRGTRMDYAVGVDDPTTHSVHKAWVAASGGFGPSRLFIIDDTGEIAWVGSHSHVDDPLAQLLAGKLDRNAAKAQQLAVASRSVFEPGTPDAIVLPAREAFGRGDFQGVIRETEKAMAAYPQNDTVMAVLSNYKLKALLHLNEEKGLEFARQLLADARYNRTMGLPNFGRQSALSSVGSAIGRETGLSKTAYLFAANCLGKAIAQEPEETRQMNDWLSLAGTYEHMDEYAQASVAQLKAVASLQALIFNSAADNKDYKEKLGIVTGDLVRLQEELVRR